MEATHSMREKTVYRYENDAKDIAMSYYDEQQEFLKSNHHKDTYLSGTYSK